MNEPIICPNCKNEIYDEDAVLCLFCGESLRREVGVFGKLRSNAHLITFFVVIGMLLLMLMALLR